MFADLIFRLTLTTPNPPKSSKWHIFGKSQHRWKLVLSLLHKVGQNYYPARIFINAQDSLDNLIGQKVITWGVLTKSIDWLIKIRTARMCQLFASCFVRRATWIWTNQNDKDYFASRAWLMYMCVPKTSIFTCVFGCIQNKLLILLAWE